MQDSNTPRGYMPQSKTVEWSTPQDLFDKYNNAFRFTVDVAANKDNAKVERYYDATTNGLIQDWKHETVWCNPPYGREIADWVHKAAISAATTVMLLPSRTDVRWFHDYVYNKPNVEVHFLKGRLKFGGMTTSAPFPSMIVIFWGMA